MKSIKELFEKYYSCDDLSKDVIISQRNHLKEYSYFMEYLPYVLSDKYSELIRLICKDVAFNTFNLGFSLATKLCAESFVKIESPSLENVFSINDKKNEK